MKMINRAIEDAADFRGLMGKIQNESKQARQHDELIAELLDSRAPKTEREHAAAREIERLRSLCDDLYSDLLAAGSLTPHDCGAYSLIQETIRLRRDRWARPMQPNACWIES